MLIAISGIDGAGKTTLAKALARSTGGLYRKQSIGRRFNQVLRLEQSVALPHAPSPLGQLLSEAYAADFVEYAKRHGLKNAAPGRIVFVDRWKTCVRAFSAIYADSPQVATRGLEAIPDPALELHLDLPCEDALLRIRLRGARDWDEEPVVLRKTRDAYQATVAAMKEAVVLDAAASKADLLKVALTFVRAAQSRC